ncbi:hypothetical protein [Tateyamaria sp. ANG-S1]|uniref:hypothetical protein n=1 Tax=Tateyamaria sp. ANG-S1 TaxID=1577905 RepID=UPI00057DF454|nr:hypothetical protein [Tateyamaria sp. ANG-S1]KIC49532.1 hypothetical protein RA29_07510 [Tateyamaria sp. ANG-S1]
MPKVSYVYDPLCGWCYGFVPALRHFVDTHPDIEIDVVPAGLIRGDRVGPYGDMLDYISKAAPKMTAVTGQPVGEAFFDMMRQDKTPMSISAPPSLAVMNMKALTSPKNVVRFAEALLVEHFMHGRDLNAAKTYDDLCDTLDLPRLNTAEIVIATEDHPTVAKTYQHALDLGVTSYPTSIVWDDAGQNRGAITSIYDPDAFASRVRQLLGTQQVPHTIS